MSDTKKIKSYKIYSRLKLEVIEIELDKLKSNKRKSYSQKRIIANEYSIQGAKKGFLVKNLYGSITESQIKELFYDMGWNTDMVFGWKDDCDLTFCYNINGYLIPFWDSFSLLLKPISSGIYETLTTRYGLGKSRFHIRLWKNNDGSWYIIAHVDKHNWMDLLNLFEALKAHLTDGNGLYELGHEMFDEMLKITLHRIENHENLFIEPKTFNKYFLKDL